MHTLGKVKNAALAAGDAAEPDDRIRGELDVVATADRLIANTTEEARQLTELYGADPAKVRTVSPGADLSCFTPAGMARRPGYGASSASRRTPWCWCSPLPGPAAQGPTSCSRPRPG